MVNRKTFALSVAAGFIISTSAVFAVDRLVPSQYPTIQAGIDAAADGDTVIVAQDTYYENINFSGKSITVTSNDPNDPNVVAGTVIDANGSGTVVTFPDTASANGVLTGFTITGGNSSIKPFRAGGILCLAGTITITNCIIIGNYAAGNGGGIFNDYGDLTLAGCTFIGNVAESNGGGIFNAYGDLTLAGCTFIGNVAEYYNAGGVYGYEGELTLTDCTFSGNSAGAEGGGVATDYEPVTLTNCTFSGNSAEVGGGMNNSHYGATATNCLFSGNSAQQGGGICSFYLWMSGGGDLTLSNCTFSGNVADDYGGAVCIRMGGNLMLTDCILWGNSANEGPQIALNQDGAVSVSYSCLQGDQGDIYIGGGGALNWLNGNIDADPCFVSGSEGDYYLSQITAGQANNSPCVDAGSDLADNLGMGMYTTRTDDIGDGGVVDMGYHYAASTLAGGPDINRDLHVDLFDYCILAAYWLQCNEPCDVNYLPGDIIMDRCVDANDLKVLVDYWLDCYVGTAGSPTPDNNASLLDPNLTLTWLPGHESLFHDVYLGTDANAVAEADHLTLEYMGTVSETSFDPCGLEFGTKYHWRVDEVGPACTQPGVVWNLTTWGEPNACLVGWWKFDEGEGSTAYDSAGDNDGIFKGDPNWIAGQIGDYALDFDGDGDYVEVSPHSSLNVQHITMSAWVKVRGTGPGTNNFVLNRKMTNPGTYGLLVKAADNIWKAQVIREGSESYPHVISSNNPATSEWTHVCATYDGDNFMLYIDGVLQDDIIDADGSIDMDNPNVLTIGAHPTPTSYFDGSIDDVRIYDRALSGEEIQQVYQSGLN
ncbi:MAG: LamG-like jellyroll fold domain-containing protein [Planctomycetota bacterium]